MIVVGAGPAGLTAAYELLDKSEDYNVVVLEEVCTGSGIRENLAWELAEVSSEYKVCGCDLGNQFVTHGSMKALYKNCKLDVESVVKFVQEVLKGEN